MKTHIPNKLPVALAIALVAAAPLAMAQNAMSQRGADLGAKAAAFTTLDLDQSGSLSKSEVAGDTTLSTYFANYDTDGNGELSREEYRHYAGKGDKRKSRKDHRGMQGHPLEGGDGGSAKSPTEDY